MNTDIILHIVKQVDSVKSLVSLCAANKQFLDVCNKHTKHIFLSLVRESQSFRQDYFIKLRQFIDNKDTVKILALLKLYPVGRMFVREFVQLNTMQNEVIEMLKEGIDLPQQQLLFLLFFPTNKFDFHISDFMETYKHLSEHHSESLCYSQFFQLIQFHAHQSQELGIHKKILNYSIKAVVQNIPNFEKSEEQFALGLFDVLERVFRQTFQQQLITTMYHIYDLDVTSSFNSTDVQDVYAPNYDFAKQVYDRYHLSAHSPTLRQSGGFIGALAKVASPALINVASKAAKSQVGQQIKNELRTELQREVGKQAYNTIDKVSSGIAHKTGVKSDKP